MTPHRRESYRNVILFFTPNAGQMKAFDKIAGSDGYMGREPFLEGAEPDLDGSYLQTVSYS
ncbi:MAG: hypothetical protein WC140_00215 [Bacteroidales bacterium]